MAFRPFFQRPKGVLLRISILQMLSIKPMHGYQLMKEIEEQTGGAWVPSHSLLYNTLSRLEEQDLVTSEKNYKGEVERTIYSLTEKGRAHLDDQIREFAHIISQMMKSVSKSSFSRMPRILLEHLDLEEQKQFLLQMRDRLQATLEEIEKDLAILDSRK